MVKMSKFYTTLHVSQCSQCKETLTISSSMSSCFDGPKTGGLAEKHMRNTKRAKIACRSFMSGWLSRQLILYINFHRSNSVLLLITMKCQGFFNIQHNKPHIKVDQRQVCYVCNEGNTLRNLLDVGDLSKFPPESVSQGCRVTILQ